MPYVVAIHCVMPLISSGVGKRTGGTRLSKHRQPAKELETFSVGVNRSYTWTRASNSRIPSAVSSLNGSFSWYVFFILLFLIYL